MTTKPGEIYRVDLGMAGKVRLMIVLSREDEDAPRALSVCAPITTANRGSSYEVELPRLHFLPERSFVNTQGLQAIQHHELSQKPVGVLSGAALESVYNAVRYLFDV
jgi:mRNA interferase MazF